MRIRYRLHLLSLEAFFAVWAALGMWIVARGLPKDDGATS